MIALKVKDMPHIKEMQGLSSNLHYPLIYNLKDFVSKIITKYDLGQSVINLKAEDDHYVIKLQDKSYSSKRLLPGHLSHILEEKHVRVDVDWLKAEMFWVVAYADFFLEHVENEFKDEENITDILFYFERFDILFNRLKFVSSENLKSLQTTLLDKYISLQKRVQTHKLCKEEIIIYCDKQKTPECFSDDSLNYYLFLEEDTVRFSQSGPKVYLMVEEFLVHEAIWQAANKNALLLSGPYSVMKYISDAFEFKRFEYIPVQEQDDAAFYENLFTLLPYDKRNPLGSVKDGIFTARNI